MVVLLRICITLDSVKVQLGLMIDMISFCSLKILPRNLTTVAKELFRTMICIKPRILQGALNIFADRNNSRQTLERMESLISKGKS